MLKRLLMQKLILLIDDDQEELIILRQAIEMAGLSHYCIWAENMERAEKLLSEVMPDLILIDFNMPIMNGLACLEKIRKMDNFHRVPIVIYSSSIDDRTRKLADAQGASCVEKPTSILQLIQYLKKISEEGKVLHNPC
jgi:CheY-like chemotaxis protein